MGHYESVRVKGPSVCLAEPPVIEAERLSNGLIEITARVRDEVESTDPDWEDEPPEFHYADLVAKFTITKEQAAEFGAALLRWGRG